MSTACPALRHCAVVTLGMSMAFKLASTPGHPNLFRSDPIFQDMHALQGMMASTRNLKLYCMYVCLVPWGMSNYPSCRGSNQPDVPMILPDSSFVCPCVCVCFSLVRQAHNNRQAAVFDSKVGFFASENATPAKVTHVHLAHGVSS